MIEQGKESYYSIFFHSDNRGHARENSASSGTIKGELKLTLEYRRGALSVMVCHARDLQIPPGSGDEPNRYAFIELHTYNAGNLVVLQTDFRER